MTKKVNDTITSTKGFLAAGVACGIKKSGNLDLGLIIYPDGATAAATFTTNKIVSAAVQVSKQHIKSSKVYGVVVNAGNANACTGKKGLANAEKMCALTAKAINRNTDNILVASTGIIGEQLPMEKVTAGISMAVKELSDSEEAGSDFARAIMTTDTVVKQAIRKLQISGCDVTIAGTVKGAGMIGPNMATTLLFITTDVSITKQLLGAALKQAIERSLNRLTVDGHQSTNDTAIILASGAAGNRIIKSQCPRYKSFAKALCLLCENLAMQMALDAEGATRMFKVIVKGAATKSEADKAARAIADYPLVKCAIHGGDPNWGRIICATGSCSVKLNPEKMLCKLDDLVVFKNGAPTNFNHTEAAQIVSQQQHTITVDLGAGSAEDFCIGCDMSAEYVKINAEYHT